MGGGTQRLVVGMFTVAPATGMVGPGQSQTITVDCIAEKPGKHDEVLYTYVYPHILWLSTMGGGKWDIFLLIRGPS